MNLFSRLLPGIRNALRQKRQLYSEEDDLQLYSEEDLMSLQQTTEENNRQEAYRLPSMNGIELHACERGGLESENRLLKAELRLQEGEVPLIGRSAKMQEAARLGEKVAPTDSSVLILGESGTGQRGHRPCPSQTEPARDQALHCGQLCGPV